ncbi:MAG TPA: polysaccharide biosynthesis/export family protein [Flavobacterium sp.]|jgi:polysaccharide export outer membrane protein
MNFRNFIATGAILFLLLFVTSCASDKTILYLQDSAALNPKVQSYANVIEPDDNIAITVTADEPELAAPFNLMYLTTKSTQANSSINESLMGYLVDDRGEIDFPVVGKVKLAGMTRSEAEDKIKSLLRPHLANPGVNLRIMNFKISVLGEVKAPGVQSVNGDRITVLEALSAAGDLTIYGKRDEIMVLREEGGTRTLNTIDITSTEFINSPYYYLAHNDVVYVKPNKTKINSSIIGPNLTVGISAISLLITIITLSTR